MMPRAAAFAALFASLCACGAAGLGEGVAGESAATGSGSKIVASPGTDDSAVAQPTSAEELAASDALFGLVNAARAEHGLKPLVKSEALAAVSRMYCAEMARTDKIAHESPISGGPADRAKKAGILFTRLTENLALAEDAVAAHDGLMNSPGHRANILDPAVTEVGIGAIVSVEAGVTSLIVTQMFASPPERIEPAAARDELTERLNAARRTKSLRPFERHPWLDARATEALGSCGSGALTYAAKAEKAPPFRLLRAVMVEGGTMDLISASFVAGEQSSSSHLTHIGVAVSRAEGDSGMGGACAVVIFAAKK